MRNAFDLKFETLLELLEDLGLDSGQIEAAEAYMENGEEENLQKLPQIDFSKIDSKKAQKFSKIYQYFKKKAKDEEYARCFHLFFTMGVSTLASILPSYEFGSHDEITRQGRFALLKPEEMLTIYAEQRRYYVYASKIESMVSFMEKTPQEELDQMFEKVELHHKDHCKCGSMLPLYAAYFKIKEENVGKEGIVSNEKTAAFLKSYEECVINSFRSLKQGKSNVISEADLKAFNKFVKEEQKDASLSEAVSFLVKKYQMEENSFSFTLGCAFINKNISHVLYNFINICLHMNLTASLNIIDRYVFISRRFLNGQNNYSTEYSDNFMGILENFSVNISKALHWCAKNGSRLAHMKNYPLESCARKYNEIYIQSLKNADADIYSIMFSALKQVSPKQAEEILQEGKGQIKQRYIEEIIHDKQVPFYDDLFRFFLGEKGMDVLYLHQKEMFSHGVSFYNNISYAFNDYLAIFGIDDTMKRIMAYYCFVGGSKEASSNSSAYSLKNLLVRMCQAENNYSLDQEKVITFFKGVDSTGLTVLCQLNAMGKCYDEGYSADILKYVVPVLTSYLTTRKEETLKAFEEANVSGRMMGVTALGQEPETYRKELLAAFSDTSKAVKDSLVEILSKKESFRGDVTEKLNSKKVGERETAVRILSKWKKEEDRKALELALEKEKSSKVSALISDILGMKAETGTEGGNQGLTLDDFVKNMTKGNRKKTLAWAFETPFSAVHDKEGKEIGDNYMMALLLCYSTMNIPGISKDAPALAELLNPQELALFMKELFEKWVEHGAESKKKWVLYAASIHGGAQVIANFQHYINEWPKASRGAIAAEAVKALALNSSPSALLIVDSISRKFKFRQVKNAAGEALTFAAGQLGLTKEELADKIVPDLGFDEHMERVFDYGERQFKVYINQALEIEIYDGNDKKLKNLPSPGKRDDEVKAAAAYAEFKLMKKQMKTTVATQKTRLELALSSERKWKCGDWKDLFIKNPIMHQFAISLIWGVYKENQLADTFRYMEDGSFNTVDEEEYDLAEDSLIGLVHPIELTEDQRKAWKEQLDDYEITQSIEQLSRSIYGLTQEERKAKYLERFGGKVVNDLSLNGKLSAMGWYRGSVLDGGGFYEYYREDAALGLGVELHFSGTYVGGENEDVTVYHVIFYKMRVEKKEDGTNARAVERGSYIYDEIKEEAIVPLAEVPKRYFSEIVYQLEKATASSTETETDWKDKAGIS